MDNLQSIDNYFKGQPTPEEIKEFEKRIIEDPEFAEDVAFYVATQQASKELLEEEKVISFKSIPLHTVPSNRNRRRLWPYSAAAAIVVGLIAGWFLFFKPADPQQLAEEYIHTKFRELDVAMGAEDSLERGKHLYNEGKQTEALQLFQDIIKNDTSSYQAKKFAGIISLRLNNFDQALSYFRQLETYTRHSNPSKFYQALTLLKRNQPGDEQQAKKLLRQVVEQDLQEKEPAQELLKKL